MWVDVLKIIFVVVELNIVTAAQSGVMSLMQLLRFMLLVWLPACCSVVAVRYTPDWTSLDSRPLPQWYDDAKVGIFLHWGVFSAPSFGAPSHPESAFLWLFWKQNVSEVVQFIKQNYPPDVTYADFAATFRAEFFDPNEWADIFKSARVKSVSWSTFTMAYFVSYILSDVYYRLSNVVPGAAAVSR